MNCIHTACLGSFQSGLEQFVGKINRVKNRLKKRFVELYFSRGPEANRLWKQLQSHENTLDKLSIRVLKYSKRILGLRFEPSKGREKDSRINEGLLFHW